MLELHMVPITTGDSTLLCYTDDRYNVNILIDAGVKPNECYHYLRDVLGLDHLDIIVASHFHWDHVGGMDAVRNSDLKVSEYWTGDLRAFEDYCRSPEASRYVLYCLVIADRPLRSRNGRNRLVWDGVHETLAGGHLELEVLAPPYSLWQNLRAPGVAAGLLKPSNVRAYQRRLRKHPSPLEIEDERERPFEGEPEEREYEEAQPLYPEESENYRPIPNPVAILDEEYHELEEPDVASLLLSGRSPWNDMSIVLRVTYHGKTGSIRFLFPGDLTDWSYVYAFHSTDAQCDVLKVPHHCSDTYIASDEVRDWLSWDVSDLIRGLRYGPDWLEEALWRSWSRLPHRRHLDRRTWHEFVYLVRRYGYDFWPILVAGMLQPGTAAPHQPVPDVLSWLAPHTAIYYPMKHGRNDLPQWHKRDRIRRAVNEMHCTRQHTATIQSGPLGPSCREVTHCRMRQDPVILTWD